MAHTYVTNRYRDVWGSRNVRKVQITLVDTYVTGGWPMTAQGLGFGSTSSLEGVVIMNNAVAGGILSWDDAAQKIKAIDYAGAEVANGFSFAGVIVHLLAIGTGKHT